MEEIASEPKHQQILDAISLLRTAVNSLDDFKSEIVGEEQGKPENIAIKKEVHPVKQSLVHVLNNSASYIVEQAENIERLIDEIKKELLG